MMLVFTLLYPVTMAREGFAYRDVILTPAQENGDTVYSGTIRGNIVRFTVHAEPVRRIPVRRYALRPLTH